MRVVAYSLDSVIQLADLWLFGYEDVEHAHAAAARFHNTRHLGQHSRRVRNVVQAIACNSQVERTIPKWQRLGVTENANKIAKPFLQCIPARQFKNCRSEVQAANPFHMPSKS